MLGVMLGVGLCLAPASPAEAARARATQMPFEAQWEHFKERFLSEDGRVIDTGNKNITHTESQGTGMLFALFANDYRSFNRIWFWTQSHMRRSDGLYAWKWDPDHPEGPITDDNNATDGDLLLAWALLLAGTVWERDQYTEAANEIIAGIEAKIIEPFANRMILRPGVYGYDGFETRTLNLSYCVFPALQEIAAHTRSDIWVDIYRDCLVFVQNANFGRYALPLDWITFDAKGAMAPAPRKPARFGYDAIRVPLYLVWAGHNTPRFIERYRKAWNQFGRRETPPSWINPFTGEAAPYEAANGFLAVRRLVDMAVERNKGRRQVSRRSWLPAVNGGDDYYSASLVMLSTLAALTMGMN